MSGEVFVTDHNNHRVQVFRKTDGAFVRSWGAQGAAAGQFSKPSGIAVSSAGLVYVADSRGHRVQVFR